MCSAVTPLQTCAKTSGTLAYIVNFTFIHPPYFYWYAIIALGVQKNTQAKLYIYKYFFILHSVWNFMSPPYKKKCLPKLPAPRKRLTGVPYRLSHRAP